jgi:chaperonin GroEL
MTNSHTKRLVFQPKTIQYFQKGINQLGDAIRPTFGPMARSIVVDRTADKAGFPEILDNGGLIARRLIALPDRNLDMGAMFLRQVIWRQYERVGDGTALTTVLFQSIYNQSVKYIVDGGNAMMLSKFLNQGMSAVYTELQKNKKPVIDREMVSRVAETICYNPHLSKYLGEIFDIVGEYGQIDIRTGRTRDIEREYVEGMTIESPLHSLAMIVDSFRKRSDLEDAAILITNFDYNEPDDIVPIIEDVYSAGIQSFMIICRSMSEKVISVLTTASRNPERFKVIAVKTPIEFHNQAVWLQDIAVLTGGRAYLTAVGEKAGSVTLEGLGKARRAWADMTYFGIIGGKGSAAEIRSHIQGLKSSYEISDDEEIRKNLLDRIGKLQGGSATLFIGGVTEHEIKATKEVAERTVQAVRETIKNGTLPGGGAAFLQCRSMMQEMVANAQSPEEKAAFKIILRALEEPTRTILQNSGFDPYEYMPLINRAGSGWSLDVRSGEIVDMEKVGIIDSAGVLMQAVREAFSSAALALSVDVLIHKKKPVTSVNP